jgi:hypothetical protein
VVREQVVRERVIRALEDACHHRVALEILPRLAVVHRHREPAVIRLRLVRVRIQAKVETTSYSGSASW